MRLRHWASISGFDRLLGRIITWSAVALWARSQWQTSPWFKPFVFAAASVALVAFAHREYLEFATVATLPTEHLFVSFALKWGLIATAVAVALGVALRRRKRRRQQDVEPVIEKLHTEDAEPPPGVDLDKPRSAAERILNERPR